MGPTYGLTQDRVRGKSGLKTSWVWMLPLQRGGVITTLPRLQQSTLRIPEPGKPEEPVSPFYLDFPDFILNCWGGRAHTHPLGPKSRLPSRAHPAVSAPPPPAQLPSHPPHNTTQDTLMSLE